MKKISDLSAGSTPTGAELLEVVQGGNSVKLTLSQIGATTSLVSAHLLVGSSGNIATDRAITGDVTISNTGVTTLANTAVTPGTYRAATLTVDAKGRLTAASGAETHSLTAQTGDIADTAFTTGNVAGLYRVHVYLLDTTSAIGAGTVTANIKYTDASQAQTQSSSAVILTTAGSFTQATFFCQLASGSITYGVTHTGVFSTAQYAFYTTCERLV